jgi:outer membrane protein
LFQIFLKDLLSQLKFMGFKKPFLVLAFIAGSFVAVAQQMTLQQCIDYALAHNITIQQAALNEDLAKVGVNQSTMNLFPNLNGFAGNNYYYGRSIDPNTNTFTNDQVRSNSFSLSSSVALFEGFSLQNTLKQSKLNYMASRFDLQKVQNDIALNVVTFYLQVLYNEELLTVTKSQRDATALQRDRTNRMFEAGALSKGNQLDMESQLAQDEVRLITAQAQYDQAVLGLKQLLEMDTVKDFSIVAPAVEPPAMNAGYTDVGGIYATALNNQPDIKSYEYRVRSAEKGVSIARGSMWPRLSGNGSLSTTYTTSKQDVKYTLGPPEMVGYTQDSVPVYSLYSTNASFTKTPFSDQLDQNLSKTVGLSLSIPIFDNWQVHNGIQRAKINLEQSQLNLLTAQKGLLKSIQQAVADAAASNQKLIAGQKSVAALTESMNYNEQKYNLGLISTYDYLLSKTNLARSQADLLQAKYDYIFRIKVIDFYLGKPLTF